MDELFAPHNLVFYIAIIAGFLMLIGSALGVGGHDVSHDLDHDHDVHHEVSGAHHGHGHNEARGHATSKAANALDLTAHETERGDPFLFRLLGLFGVGKVPITIVLMMAFLLFGGAGVVMNRLLESHFRSPQVYGWISFAVAIFVALILTGSLAKLAGRLMPSSETYNVTKEDLVGKVGKLVVPTDESGGLLQARDREGNLHQVQCRTNKGDLPNGTEVLILDHDPGTNMFIVEAAPESVRGK